ncbi:hypothetical protein KIPB_002353 [Kipferlia bialata]|uniref:Uncharacterized protein n=1 Tax=Kipferlia bialata TaxID=797122 RepID=A0A9K3CSL7_9EUKA|nr:hypothetical protein KIPB_002353 [Kipferlia bialata]|eukprot:g2353.t1
MVDTPTPLSDPLKAMLNDAEAVSMDFDTTEEVEDAAALLDSDHDRRERERAGVNSLTSSLARTQSSGLEVVGFTSSAELTHALSTGKPVLLEQGTEPTTIAKCLYRRYQESKGFGSASVLFMGNKSTSNGTSKAAPARGGRGGRGERGGKGRPARGAQAKAGPVSPFKRVVDEFAKESGMPIRGLYRSPGPLLLGVPTEPPTKDFRVQPQDVTLVVLEIESYQGLSAKLTNSTMYNLKGVVHTGQAVQMVLIGPEQPKENMPSPTKLYKKFVQPIIYGCESLTAHLNEKYLPRKRHIERCMELLGNRALDGSYFTHFIQALQSTEKVVSCGISNALTENTLYSLIMSLADPAAEVTPDHPPVLVVACNSDIHTIVHALSSACCVVGLALSRAIPGTTVKRHADIMVCDINDIDTCLREGVFATDALEEIVCIGKYATQLWESLSDEVAQALDVNSPRVLTHSGKNVSVQAVPRGYKAPAPKKKAAPKPEKPTATFDVPTPVPTPAKETEIKEAEEEVEEEVVVKAPPAALPVPASLPAPVAPETVEEVVAAVEPPTSLPAPISLPTALPVPTSLPLPGTVAAPASLPLPGALPLLVETESLPPTTLPLPISAPEVSAPTAIPDYVPTPLVINPVEVSATLPTSLPLPGVSETEAEGEAEVVVETAGEVAEVAPIATPYTGSETEAETMVETLLQDKSE